MNRPVRPCPEWDRPPEWVEIARLEEQLTTDPAILAILNTVPPQEPGSDPLPGAVGEWIEGEGTAQIPLMFLGDNPTYRTILALQPSIPAGDWMVYCHAHWEQQYQTVYFFVGAPPLYMSTDMSGGFFGGAYPLARVAVGKSCHWLTDGPRGLVFNLEFVNNSGIPANPGTFTLHYQAVRLR